MNTRLRDLWTSLVTALAARLPVRPALALAVGAGVLALGLGLAWWVQRPFMASSAAAAPPPSDRRLADDAGHRPDDERAADGGAIEYQRTVERTTEERIESLLATVVGPGKVVARVAAAIDLARTERTEETYDPDKTVLREQHSAREATGGAKLGGGGRGTESSATPADGFGHRGERRDESQTYEVSKVVSHTVAPLGGVKSLSVAVLVDGTYRDEDGTRVFVPRTDAELATLKALVASAVGFSESRGDRLEVTSAPFQAAMTQPRATLVARAAEWAPIVAGRVFGMTLALGVLWLLVRLVQAAAVAATAPAVRTRLGSAERDDAEGRTGVLARENEALARQDPEHAAQLVRQWLLEDDAGAVRS